MAVFGPLALTMFLWWFATGAILYLDGLPRRTYRWTILAATVLTGAAFAMLVVSAHDASASGATTAFVCAIVIWGWNEIAFLMGGITGSRRSDCPAGAQGWRRFAFAFQTLAWHEALLAACGVLILAATWQGTNKTALWTYLVLWIMRTSAKLNIFAGVPNITHEFLPSHLAYLKTYFRTRRATGLLPLSVGAGTLAVLALVLAAIAAPADGFEETALTLLASLTALAVVEHIFMAVPLPFGALWAWAMRGTAPATPKTVPIKTLPMLSEPRAVSRAGGGQ